MELIFFLGSIFCFTKKGGKYYFHKNYECLSKKLEKSIKREKLYIGGFYISSVVFYFTKKEAGSTKSWRNNCEGKTKE